MNSGSSSNNDPARRKAAGAQPPPLDKDRLLNLSSDAILVRDAGDRIVYWNQGAVEAYGFSRDAALGRVCHDLLRTEFPDPLPEIFEALHRNGRWSGELVHTRKDGAKIVVSSRWALDRSAHPAVILETNTDVTERKHSEDAMRENEPLLRFHVENTPLAVVEWGPDFRLRRWSGEAERIFGWRADEVLGKRIDEVRWVYEEDVQQVAEISAGLTSGTHVKNVSRNRNYRKDGSIVHCEWYNSSLVDESGKLVSILSLVLDVSERKQAEEQVRKTLESIGDGFFACDAEWRFVYLNTVAERLLGIKRSKVLGQDCWRVFPLTVGTKLESEYRRAAAGEVRRFENFYEPWGRWFHNRCFPREGGGLSVYFQDITESKRAEEESRRSTSLIRAITELTGDVIFAKDRQGRLTFANPATLALIGKESEQVIGKTLVEVLADRTTAREVMENERQIMDAGITKDVEEDVPLLDGTRHVWLSRKIPFRDANGKVIGLFGISRDITERKRVEAELDRISQQRQLALDAARMGWWHYDAVTQTVIWDRRYGQIHQLDGDQGPMGQILATLIPEDVPHMWAAVEQALNPAGPHPYAAEYRVKLRDGSLRWVEVHGIAVFEGEGTGRSATGFIGTAADITERKRTEQALMRSEKLAVLGRMAATVAHEINNPLAAVTNTGANPDVPNQFVTS